MADKSEVTIVGGTKMPRLFAFLRAINAGHGRAVSMNVVRKAFESLGFDGVATFPGSGNVVFETRAKDIRTLEQRIERRLQQALGYKVAVLIRAPAELKEIGAFEPLEDSEIHGADLISFCLRTILTNGPRRNS